MSITLKEPQVAALSIEELPQLLVGANTEVPTLTGPKKYINFDNAASTPTFQPIADSVMSFLKWYSNVHRGTGYKSQLSSWAFEQARDLVTEFVHADLDKQVVIFTKNSTEAINKLSHRLPIQKGDIILTSMMEHHSNELPWRRVGEVQHIAVDSEGRIIKEDFENKLKLLGSKIKLVAITGASNVTGYINDLDYFAAKAHSVGAKIIVDGAQLIPHRPVDMKSNDPVHCIDFLVFSAHKMYAPFGIGVLVGDKATFIAGDPQDVGGGVVDIVTLEEAYWTSPPDKEEAGTPDIVGVVALGKAIKIFQSLGWDAIIKHEAELAEYALRKLNKIPEVTIYGDSNPAHAANRLGVISFNIAGVPHNLSSAILGYEAGIGVRSGCFCAQPYVKSLLSLTCDQEKSMEERILARDRSQLPGAIRVSFGLYNTKAEIDELIEMVKKIATGDYHPFYVVDRESGSYVPKGFKFDFKQVFEF
ncbi:MAG TPA: aminotransferase class V-fold PLP-dependent enzyme [candidate division Zixibacteria bacterium]|nr:aminotransferase class V-fold PLP-dependent enzyme [candidate division Zixibacteria bacterium]